MEINNENAPWKDETINNDTNNIFLEVNSNNNKCEKDNFSKKISNKKKKKKISEKRMYRKY